MTTEAGSEFDLAGEKGAVPTCRQCGSEDVVRDAWAAWNPQTGLWELQQVFDQAMCRACEQSTGFVWKRCQENETPAVRRLNDALRNRAEGGTILITTGVRSKGADFVDAALKAVAAFDDFAPDNDPQNEHDFGALEVHGERIFFKLDYFDESMTAHSPDPADPKVTRRVMTIMLAEEY